MKKEYAKPEIELIDFQAEDVVTDEGGLNPGVGTSGEDVEIIDL